MVILFIKVVIMLLFPGLLIGNGELHDHELMENHINDNSDEHSETESEDIDDGDGDDNNNENGYNGFIFENNPRSWYSAEIDKGVKWWLELDGMEFGVHSGIQHLTIITTKEFGKALTIDGLLQTAELDEYIYHECLVHPALLIHDEPKTVFIMGGGSGSASREVLKHKEIEKVKICEIDRLVHDLCLEHMPLNHEAFNDERLHIVFNDAKEELNSSEEKFDVIVGDVCDPHVLSAHSNNLYTKSFYEDVVKPKLKDNGIFVTQAGPAGLLSHKAVFSPVHNTIKQVFTHVVAYTALVPSYGDSCGFVMASNEPINFDAKQLNNRIAERIAGELKYVDGPIFAASTVFSRTLKNSLREETCVLIEENVGLVQGRPRTPRYI